MKRRRYHICFKSGKKLEWVARYSDLINQVWFKDVLWVEPFSYKELKDKNII